MEKAQNIRAWMAPPAAFQVANTWPKITACGVYAKVRNRKEPENPYFSVVAATFEKAITYVFAGSPIRNPEPGILLIAEP